MPTILFNPLNRWASLPNLHQGLASAFGVRPDKAVFPRGRNPTRLSLQPKAPGATMEATK